VFKTRIRICARLLLLLAAPLLAATAGCNPREPAPKTAQIAARVNGAEITVEKLSGASRATALQALDRVIDRELLVQQALEARLERDPQVAQSIDNARRQILAQAYLERRLSGKIHPDEVRAFYAENPALFSQRRIYRTRQLEIAAPVERVDLLKAEVARARDLEDVVLWVTTRGLKHRITSLTQPAEELPLAQLPEVSRMREGELAVFGSAFGVTVVQLVHVQDAALAESQAAPMIEQLLAGRKRLELAAAEVKRLREVAAIEYVGEFKRN